MTEREPLLTKESFGVRIGKDILIYLVDDGPTGNIPKNLRLFVNQANAIFDARMKEAENKAVEEFRRKVVSELERIGQGEINIFENTAGEHGDYSFGRAFLQASEFVKELPTEPEECK